jgi:hypothetical protein
MKKNACLLLTAFIMASGIFAVDAPATVTPPAQIITAVLTSAAITPTAQLTAVFSAPAAATQTADASGTTSAAGEAPFIEGVMPPALETGAYEEPGEPAPTAEEAAKAVEKKSEARKNKHFTIEQTLYTPSSIGTKLGYFINENWRATVEYSTISGLIARSAKGLNESWAIGGNYSPADDDWAPFYGAGFSSMDLQYKDKIDSDNVNVTQQFTGGYVCAGVTWISDSIFMASIEFDLYGGRTRLKKEDLIDNSKSSDAVSATLNVMIGATVGLCF